MKLKSWAENALLTITFILISFIACIDDIYNIYGILIILTILMLVIINIYLLDKYGREFNKD